MNLDKNIYNTIKHKLDTPKILVVGDVMLDRYWFGDVDRISPEAPIPIAKIKKIEDRPGGAANVARNIANLGGNVTLLSVVGLDEGSQTLQALLQAENVNVILKSDPSISTIIKIRVLSRNQQLIRIDFEETPSHEILTEILETYINIIHNYDVIVLSDYGKGGLSHTQTMIKVAKEHNKIILIDPKGDDYNKYKGATLITPNKNELRAVIGSWLNETELQAKTKVLQNNLGLDYLLLTRSEEGMTLFNLDGSNTSYPTHAKEVYDVSGAGDTVIATLSLMLANKIEINQAVQIANIAAGIVVGKLGTATTTQKELLHEMITLTQ